MSKSRIVEIIEQSGNSYGQISSPADIVKAQEYAHAHAEQITLDFLTNAEIPEIVDCDYALTNGLNIQIDSGRIYRYGLQYEVAGQTVTLSPAANQARIDLIIATLSNNVPANLEFLAFQRLRSEQEFINTLPPYPPTQFQRATEKH